MGWIHYTKARCFPVRFLAVFLALLLSFPVPTFAGETPETATIETLLEMRLEELIEVEISIATRSLLAIRKAPAPVGSVFPEARFIFERLDSFDEQLVIMLTHQKLSAGYY